jgi:hypothetical protein
VIDYINDERLRRRVQDLCAAYLSQKPGTTVNNGSLEKAQMMAAHESPRTTKLYDRTNDQISLDEVERILLE